MTVLVLGASSQIGGAIAREFSRSNHIILAGRSMTCLDSVKDRCLAANAASVHCIVHDLTLGGSALLDSIPSYPIDIIIDAASATSRKRDDAIDAAHIEKLVIADILAHIEIVDGIFKRQTVAPAVVLISTVLTWVRSPDREIYSSLKVIYEMYLRRRQAVTGGFQLMIVYVATLIDTGKESAKANSLGAAVRSAYENKRDRLVYGASGRFLIGLYYLQPVIYRVFMTGQRIVRRALSSTKLD
jgi:short-subunit dehydrogenase involved in D-alanine esterification of teichoic acids